MRVLTPGRPPERYLVHLAFSLSPTGSLEGVPGSQTEKAISLRIGDNTASLRASGSGYIIEVPDLPSYQLAQKLLLDLSASLFVLALQRKVGVRFNHRAAPVREGGYFLPGSWPPAVAAGWRLEGDRFPVEGEISSYETAIVPTHRQVVERDVVGFYPVKVISPALLADAFDVVRREIDAERLFGNPRLILAFDAFSTAYHHHVPAMTFVTLVTVLEILGDREEKAAEIQRFVRTCQTHLEEGIGKTSDPELKRELTNLRSRLGDWKRQSIQEAICDLVVRTVRRSSGPSARESVEAEIKEMYEIRSDLVHQGRVRRKGALDPNKRFWEGYNRLQELVSAILEARVRNWSQRC